MKDFKERYIVLTKADKDETSDVINVEEYISKVNKQQELP